MCNGGIDASTVLDEHLDCNHHCIQTSNGDMWVADTLNPSKGLRHTMPCGMPTFIRLPRQDSLEIFGSCQNLCSAMCLCAKSQSGSLSRGKCNHAMHIMMEEGGQLCWVISSAITAAWKLFPASAINVLSRMK